MMKKQKRGFTLVELLAALAVLSLVVTISVYTTTGIITKTREKSYKTMVNNVLAAGGNYSVENPEMSEWTTCESGNCEYQCISINELISNGYFKGDILESEVAEDTKLKETDFVYVERDKDNKAITNKEFKNSKCKNSDLGNILFNVVPTSWANQKQVIITYTLNSNQNIDDYKVEYSFDGVDGQHFSESNIPIPSSRVKVVQPLTAIKENGVITARMGTIEKKLYISTIDNVKPKIDIYESKHNLNNNQTISIKLSDSESGIKGYYFGKTNPKSSSVIYEETVNAKELSLTKEVDSAGKWYLMAVDLVGNYSEPISLTFYETKLNGTDLVTVVPGRLLDVDSKEYALSRLSVTVAPYYTFKNWNTKADGTGTSIDSTKVGKYSNLYAYATENLFSGSVSISGKTETGNSLTISTSSITATNPENEGHTTYTYQWYRNTTNSNSGGTKISGATNKSYKLTSSDVGKYIYAVVTASKNNYRTNTFTSNVSSKITSAPPPKSANPIVVSANTLTYNGSSQKLVTVKNAKGTVWYSTSTVVTSSNYNGVGSTTIPSKTNASTYTVHWYVTGNDSYLSDSGSVSVTIYKASNPISISGKSLTYNGNYQNLVTVSGAQGTVYYTTSKTILTSANYSAVGSTSIPSKKDIDTYTIYYYVTGNGNYNAKSSSVTATISCSNYTCPSGYIKSGTKCCPSTKYGGVHLSGNKCIWESDSYVDGLVLDRLAHVTNAQKAGYTTFVNYLRYTEYKNSDSFFVFTSYGESYSQTATDATCAS